MGEFTIVARFVHFAAVTLLAGTLLFRLYAGFDTDRVDQAIREPFDRWLRHVVLWAALAALLSALVWADSLAVSMGGGWEYAFDPETFAAVLFDTAFGRVWVWRLILAAALVMLVVVPPPWPRAQRILLALLALALVASIAGVTHAAMHTGVEGTTHQLADAIHLLCAAFWLGGLVALAFVLSSARRDRQWADFAQYALLRYSKFGVVAVCLLLLTGIVNTIFLASLKSLVATAYGAVLIAKICLFLGMVMIALINRQILLSRLLATSDADACLAALSRSVRAEQALGVFVLVLVSVLGTLPPPH